MQTSQLALSPTSSLPPVPSATASTPTAPTPLSTITTIPLSTERAATPIAAKNGWQKEYVPSIESKFLSPTAIPEEITLLLFAQYLEHYRTVDADSRSRLSDYQILNVTLPTDDYYTSNSYTQKHVVDKVLWVLYSVKPYVFLFSNWNAGNGITTDDYSWIRKKVLLVGIWQQNDTWYLKGIGTGG
jgi:hypothetical protein